MVGRNEPCTCGSGMKYKICCGWFLIKGGATGVVHKTNTTHEDRRRVAQIMPLFMASMMAEENISRLERRMIRRGN